VSRLASLGFTSFFEASFRKLDLPGGIPARVAAGHGRLCRVVTDAGELLAEPLGRLRHQASAVTGDWVVVRPLDPGRAALLAVLPRRSAFSRKAAGAETAEQVVAANVDTVFLVLGLDSDYSPRRLERYMVLARESGARPVALLNKADLCDDLDSRLLEIQGVAAGAPVHAVCGLTGAGLEALAPELTAGRTVALLGSSGAGKSTLVNRLAGSQLQRTREVRASDGKGRHTTTARELVILPSGALLIDTPGMRELQLWAGEEALDAVFQDVSGLASTCRFRDCRHEAEPGCAVREAAAAGRLAPERLESHAKLQRELRHLEARRDQRVRQAEKARWKTIHKRMRSFKPRS
jgi:ribosome biogenesis GTPase / thiamine phosphate phosphatase